MNDHCRRQGNRATEQNPAYGPLQPNFYVAMTDDQKWQEAIAFVQEELKIIQDSQRLYFRELSHEIIALKEQLQSLGDAAGSGTLCVSCAGQCCAAGKYHFTAVDLLVHLSTDEPLFVPDFTRAPLCPYSSGSGCFMAAGYRPYNCITFMCELIEEELGLAEKHLFYSLCDELKKRYALIEELCGRRFMGGLLQNFDRMTIHCDGMLGIPLRSE